MVRVLFNLTRVFHQETFINIFYKSMDSQTRPGSRKLRATDSIVDGCKVGS